MNRPDRICILCDAPSFRTVCWICSLMPHYVHQMLIEKPTDNSCIIRWKRAYGRN